MITSLRVFPSFTVLPGTQDCPASFTPGFFEPERLRTGGCCFERRRPSGSQPPAREPGPSSPTLLGVAGPRASPRPRKWLILFVCGVVIG